MHACLWQVLFRRFLIVIFFVSSNTFDCDVTIGLELMHILFLNIIFFKAYGLNMFTYHKQRQMNNVFVRKL